MATAATTVPANAAPRNTIKSAKLFATSPGATIRAGDRCWKQTDGSRGYGFWTGCDRNYSFAVPEVEKAAAKTGRGRGGTPGDEDPGRGGTDGGGGGGGR